MVDSASTIIAELEGNVAESDGAIETLEQLRPLLSDKDAIIANLDEQVKEHKAKYTFAIAVIDQKDVQIFSLTRQAVVMGQRLTDAEALIQIEKSLRLEAEHGWSQERLLSASARKSKRMSRALAVGSLSAVGAAQVDGTSVLSSVAVGAVVSIVTYLVWK
jgi:hypothetical protein